MSVPVVRPAPFEHSFLTKPALADPLWRYMDFSKFVAMLVNGGLYLSRIDRLGDIYEGWVPKPVKKHYGGFFVQEEMERDNELRKRSSVERRNYYVSCWHANDEQSDAMWKLYVKGAEGIAIRTTCRNLQASLADTPEELWLYKVMYTNYEKEPNHGGSMLRACLTKRKPFAHEEEVRVIWYMGEDSKFSPQKGTLDSGFYVQCNLANLIEQVYVAPTEHPWFVPIVKDILEKYGINAEVIQSGLNLMPQ